jgi:type I restriction enzyme, R subunit
VVANLAIDTDLVFVTTELRARDPVPPLQHRLRGLGKPGGKGNSPTMDPGSYATSYLWEQIWQPDTWLDLLERFVHLQKEKGTERPACGDRCSDSDTTNEMPNGPGASQDQA